MLKNELTLNVKLSATALQLRALRFHKALTREDVSHACNISIEDITNFETDKKKPTKKQLVTLLNFLS